MLAVIFFLLFVGTLLATALVISRMVSRIGEVERNCAELQVEENRVFDFLHHLGEAFAGTAVQPASLHRLIVEGATRILDAQGGALYLLDRSETSFAPAFISAGCPPLASVPQQILEQAIANPAALESHLRLQTLRPSEGILGQIALQAEPKLIQGENFPPNAGRNEKQRIVSALIGPLYYRRKCLGVLCLANGVPCAPLSQRDLGIFRIICEQAAFALFSVAVYAEATEKKRMDHDLAIAREIQSILLPSDPPRVPGFDISGVNLPARQVSGDYFDYIAVDEHRTGIAIADVSGKGVPASLIMAMGRSVIRSQAIRRSSAAEVLHVVNRQLYPDIKEDMFMSMAYVILDTKSSEVCMARAGHDPPLLYRGTTGNVERVNPKGMALGIDSGEVFDRVCADFYFRMEDGDCLLLYTDGATEAMDGDGNEFGTERLAAAFRESVSGGSSAVIRRLTENIKSFVGNCPQYDDITLIVIRKR